MPTPWQGVLGSFKQLGVQVALKQDVRWYYDQHKISYVDLLYRMYVYNVNVDNDTVRLTYDIVS
jgi:hypothetical protein